jgi:hypothetical protein
VLDKLTLLSKIINSRFAAVAGKEGQPAGGYASVVDLRKTKYELPARLFCKGRYSGIHKLEIIGVARLGLPRTQEIVECIFPNLHRVNVYRIDLAVDLPGFSPWFFVTNSRISHRQNYALYRSRGAVSYYLQFSKQRKIVFYDRLRLLRQQNNPLAKMFGADDELTRFEIQMMGAAVPFRRFVDLHLYADIKPLAHLHFRKVIVAGGRSPAKRLAGYGLNWLISKYGQQATSRMFSPPEWAALRKVYLESTEHPEFPAIQSMMRRSIRRWLEGKIVFPRVRDNAK